MSTKYLTTKFFVAGRIRRGGGCGGWRWVVVSVGPSIHSLIVMI